MEYAYHGGWLTPFIEEIGLHKAKRWQQAILERARVPGRRSSQHCTGRARRRV